MWNLWLSFQNVRDPVQLEWKVMRNKKNVGFMTHYNKTRTVVADEKVDERKKVIWIWKDMEQAKLEFLILNYRSKDTRHQLIMYKVV